MIKVLILGSTGSIGVQTLSVIDNLNSLGYDYKITGLAFHSNSDIAIKQIIKYKPSFVGVVDEKAYNKISFSDESQSLKIFNGLNSAVDICREADYDICINAIVGFAGLLPSYEAIKKCSRLCLANKETIVSDGVNILSFAKEKNVEVVPVDSEHSAIFQCLMGNNNRDIKRLILTASGGPFVDYSFDDLKNVTPEMALRNPNWSMGNRITVDSASMVNKGFEVIEASRLFNVDLNDIDVLVHRQSIVHSMVEFYDGSVMAQLGVPDMQLPIQYSLVFPNRPSGLTKNLSLSDVGKLTFEKVRYDLFKGFSVCLDALKRGGNSTAVLNAADEVAVSLFLEKRIRFTDIPDVLLSAIDSIAYVSNPCVEEIINSDKFTREFVLKKFG